MKLDWLLYAGALAAIVTVARIWAEDTQAPAAPPPPGVGEMSLFANFTPFATGSIINLPAHRRTTGTTFSLSSTGEWVVSRDSVAGCEHPYINIGGNLGVPFETRPIAGADNYLIAVTNGGARSLQIADPETIEIGMRGFMPGYTVEGVAEATGRLIGRTELRPTKRSQSGEVVMAWAKAGQTREVRGGLSGLVGGPVVDGNSHVIGITLKTKPRRGRIYTSTPETLDAAAVAAGHRNDFESEEMLHRGNYGVVSDTLRRTYRVAQVGCILS